MSVAARSRMCGLILGGTLVVTQSILIAGGGAVRAERDPLTLHVVFNNVPGRAGLTPGWGFACLIEGLEKVVLFDTGADGATLLSNMGKLGLDATAVEAVVFSHFHTDHTGGLDALMERSPGVTVFMPESFPGEFQHALTQRGATIETVSEPRKLFGRLHSTGEMGGAIREQALILDTSEGLVVLTGCAHPNVADMAERASTSLGKPIDLLVGGFHLGNQSEAEIGSIIRRLKNLGVRRVAPSHCTGETAIRLFRDAWKDDFVESGLGAVIEVPR